MKIQNITVKLAVLSAVMGTCSLASVSAQDISFTGSDNTGPNGPRDAGVDFEIVHGMLQVTLANTGPQPTTPPSYDATYSLLGVSFNFSGGTLTPYSALLNGSSLVPNTFVMEFIYNVTLRKQAERSAKTRKIKGLGGYNEG